MDVDLSFPVLVACSAYFPLTLLKLQKSLKGAVSGAREQCQYTWPETSSVATGYRNGALPCKKGVFYYVYHFIIYHCLLWLIHSVLT